ncbi:MAG: hypothetical protein J6B75_07835 [Ruminococcus sp.]|nr:hypothetical protein [Ruminococcus sp.]
MKKILSSLIAVSLVMGLCSCSEKSSSESESSSRISTAPLDAELIGTWMNDLNGYKFGENRKVSLVVDYSENAHFTADGAFQTMNALIPKENVEYDGNRIFVTNTAYSEEYSEDLTSVLIDMVRLDEENTETFDGHYHILGGVATDVLAEQLGFAPEKFYFEADVEGEKLVIYMTDCFDYETIDGKIDIFSDLLNYKDESADALSYEYKIDNDTLTMTLQGVDGVAPEVYQKVEEN